MFNKIWIFLREDDTSKRWIFISVWDAEVRRTLGKCTKNLGSKCMFLQPAELYIHHTTGMQNCTEESHCRIVLQNFLQNCIVELYSAFLWFTSRILRSWGFRILNPENLKIEHFWGFKDPKSWGFRILNPESLKKGHFKDLGSSNP